MEPKESNECKQHKGKKLEYACLDSNCKSNALACISCIKAFHGKCNDNLTVERSELHKIKFDPSKNKDEAKRYKDFLAKKREELEKKFKSLETTYFAGLDVGAVSEKSSNEVLDSVRRLLRVSGTIESPKYEFISSSSANISGTCQAFSQDLDKILNEAAQSLSSISIGGSSKRATLADFCQHNLITGVETSEGVEFSVKDIQANYYTVFSKESAKSGKYKISIKQLFPTGRWLDMGVLTDAVFKQRKGTGITGWLMQDTWAFGCTSVHQLQGTGLVESPDWSDPTALEVGMEFTVEWDSDLGEVVVTEKGGKVNMKGQIPKGNLYAFYFVLYYSNMKVVADFA